MQLIENILGKKNNIKVLRHLIKHKNWQFNITELAKDIYINKGVLSRLIDDLEKENVIRVSKKGKIKLFSINKENLFIKTTIIPLFEKEDIFYYEILDKFVKKIKKNAISVIAYGSVVSKEIKLTSDIDILVIIDKKNKILEDKINKLKEEFLDNDLLLRVDLINIKELRKLYKIKEPFMVSLIKNHKTLYGKPLMEMVK
ncbi:nucleotidyltransferase domain-containing protein [Candidatus Woesearchaeota archaeon]|nr:nucleotidyltransferase domain-containing protein [Candidatus Woesearchaeota archaeon]